MRQCATNGGVNLRAMLVITEGRCLSPPSGLGVVAIGSRFGRVINSVLGFYVVHTHLCVELSEGDCCHLRLCVCVYMRARVGPTLLL